MTLRIDRFRGETLTPATSQAFATFRGVPPGMNRLDIEMPSSTLEAMLLTFCPKIQKIWFYDASADRYYDLTDVLTDRNTATGSGIRLGAWQTNDYLYVGSPSQFLGLAVDVTNTNGAGTATMTAGYSQLLDTWGSLSVTDGTRSTATLDQDGLITWTAPEGWRKVKINSTEPPLYYARLVPDAALTDTSISIVELVAVPADTLNVATDALTGLAAVRFQTHNSTRKPDMFRFDPDLVGGIRVLSTSLTTSNGCRINWYHETDHKGT